MTESATIERKAVSLPTSRPRTLTTKDSIPIYPPSAKYITNGHFAVLTRLWPNKGQKEPTLHKATRQRCRSLSKQIGDMIRDVPDGDQPEIKPYRAILSCEGGNVDSVVFTDKPWPLAFNWRYYHWITAVLGLTIHDRPDNHQRKTTHINVNPYPIKNKAGKIVGMIMPLKADLKYGQVMVDIAS